MNTKKENIVGLTPRTDAQRFGASCAEDFCRQLERELNAALHSRDMAQARCKQMEDQNLALRKQVDDRDRIIDRMIGHTHECQRPAYLSQLGCMMKNDQYHK